MVCTLPDSGVRSYHLQHVDSFQPQDDEEAILLGELRESSHGTLADSTLQQYELCFLRFSDWCWMKGRDPFDKETMNFSAALWFAKICKSAESFSVVKQAHAMLCNLGDRLQQPVGSRVGGQPLIAARMEKAKRVLGLAPKNKKAGFTWELLDNGVEIWMTSGIMIFKMGAIMFYLMWVAWLRYSD